MTYAYDLDKHIISKWDCVLLVLELLVVRSGLALIIYYCITDRWYLPSYIPVVYFKSSIFGKPFCLISIAVLAPLHFRWFYANWWCATLSTFLIQIWDVASIICKCWFAAPPALKLMQLRIVQFYLQGPAQFSIGQIARRLVFALQNIDITYHYYWPDPFQSPIGPYKKKQCKFCSKLLVSGSHVDLQPSLLGGFDLDIPARCDLWCSRRYDEGV